MSTMEKLIEQEEEEKKIPVFTVTKNNAIIKNIFVLSRTTLKKEEEEKEEEETLVVGRIPNCNIILSHPSISRFHLHILSHPSSSSLSVLDLSSLHGTWVMGKKIEPNVRVELKEGDTMQLGGSSRVYKLHWVPLSQAYDIENPFVSPSDGCLHAEDRGQKGMLESDIGLHENNQVQSLDDDSEVSDYEVSDGKSRHFLKNEISTLSLFEKVDAENKSIAGKKSNCGIISNSFSEQLGTESETETETSSWFDEVLSETEIQHFAKDQKSSQKLVDRESGQNLDFLENSASLYTKENTENPFSANFSLFSEIEIQQLEKEIESQKYQKSSQKLMDREPEQNFDFLERSASPYLNEYSENPVSTNFNLIPEVEIHQLDKKNKSQKENICTPSENDTTSKSDQEKKMGHTILSEKLATEYEISYLSDEIFLKTENEQFDKGKANTKVDVPKVLEQNVDFLESLADLFSRELGEHSCSPDVKHLLDVETQEITASIENKFKSDLSDPRSIENNEVTESSFDSLDAADEASTPYKENCTSNTLALNLLQHDSSSVERKEEISKNLFTDLNEQFTPDKENFTPNTLLMRSMVKMSQGKDTNASNLYLSSSLEHIVSGSIEEIRSLKLLQEWELPRSSSRTRKDKIFKSGMENSSAKGGPLQPLFEYSSGMSKSEASTLSSTNKSCNPMKHAKAIDVKEYVRKDKRKWHMIVDTSCLLDSGSRKALQLLQGIKGTQLIVPRTVIKELDSMNRQGSTLFRRRTEASCALLWIKECLADTDWWIHIESSEKDPMPIEPTPPSIPESRFSEVYHRLYGGTASSVFTTLGSLFEIVSPTAEDYALEYALQLRNGNDGKFVLLSNDDTVKVKAMAEGLMCETAQDFRRSLVNPFSERFLWSGSSPRGLTWSCTDDIILKEKFYGYYNKLGAGEGAKGLKLIVLT